VFLYTFNIFVLCIVDDMVMDGYTVIFIYLRLKCSGFIYTFICIWASA
jgi:hypothetical protein